MASQEESTALPAPTNHISQRLNNQALSCIPNNQLIKSFTALSAAGCTARQRKGILGASR
jgi:hypothetical protein